VTVAGTSAADFIVGIPGGAHRMRAARESDPGVPGRANAGHYRSRPKSRLWPAEAELLSAEIASCEFRPMD
jgi:hypothetical protein